jgi:hypothetical protein
VGFWKEREAERSERAGQRAAEDEERELALEVPLNKPCRMPIQGLEGTV